MKLSLAIALAACSSSPPTAAPAVTVRVPAIVDSHVHLAFWPVEEQLAEHGVGAVVDLAAPRVVTSDRLHVISAGPMLTQPGGYPLDSWGRDGYGLGCADAACIDAAIDRLASQGARVIKLAVDPGGLDPALVPHAVEKAHALELKVAVHALTDRSAALAAAANADILAHTPVEALKPETIAAWKGRAVISTLAAFGGAPSTIANLRALRDANVTVLYGTDLGNLRDAGPSREEIDLLRKAGLDDAAILDSMTTTPLRYWGFPEDSWLVLDEDPRRNVAWILAPREVWLRGRQVRR